MRNWLYIVQYPFSVKLIHSRLHLAHDAGIAATDTKGVLTIGGGAATVANVELPSYHHSQINGQADARNYR